MSHDTRLATDVSRWDVTPGEFVSLRYGPNGSQYVAVSDMATGAVVRDLLPATTADGMQVTGLALDHAGNLWITYSSGPFYRTNVANGDPRPDSCANQVDVVHAGSGRVTVALRTDDNVLISDAEPSPDGQDIMYQESGCTGYETSYIQIQSLSSEQHWSIGQALPDCHLLSGVAWSTSGGSLLMDYGPAGPPYSHVPSPAACAQWSPGRLVQVQAAKDQPSLTGTTVLADPGCQIDAVAGTEGGGALAVEGCGGAPSYITGTVNLLVIGPDGQIDQRFPLGACVDGAQIATNQAGTAAMIEAYFSCTSSAQVTRLWEYRDGALHRVLSIPGDGGALSLLAW
jgi:hypothetical protein